MIRVKLVGYTRVSTEEQASEGVSLDAQRARLQAYAHAFGHELVELIEDAGVSAKSLKRPGLKRALKLLRSGLADGLLVTKIDRLTRNVRDLVDLTDRYFGNGRHVLASVAEAIDTGSAAGRMVLNLLGVIAQMEREQIGERTREALRHKKSKGAKLGAAPMGKRRDGDAFIDDPAELAVLERARELTAQGFNLSQVARQLGVEGKRTKRGGGVWHATSVRRLLERAAECWRPTR